MNFLALAQHNIDQYTAEQDRVQEERRKFMADPTNAEKVLSHFSRGLVPEKKLAKIPIGSDLAKVEGAIPSDDPRKGLASKMLPIANQLIAASPNKHPINALADAYKQFDEAGRAETYKYIQADKSALWGGGTVPTPDWYEAYDKTVKRPTGINFMNPLETAAIGAGGMATAIAAKPLVKAIANKATLGGLARGAGWLLSKMPMTPTPVSAIAKIAAMGLMAIPEGIAWDIAATPIRNSEWAQNRPITAGLVEAIPGLVGVGALHKGMNKLLAKNDAVREILGLAKAKAAVTPTAEAVVEEAKAGLNADMIRSQVLDEAANLHDNITDMFKVGNADILRKTTGPTDIGKDILIREMFDKGSITGQEILPGMPTSYSPLLRKGQGALLDMSSDLSGRLSTRGIQAELPLKKFGQWELPGMEGTQVARPVTGQMEFPYAGSLEGRLAQSEQGALNLRNQTELSPVRVEGDLINRLRDRTNPNAMTLEMYPRTATVSRIKAEVDRLIAGGMAEADAVKEAASNVSKGTFLKNQMLTEVANKEGVVEPIRQMALQRYIHSNGITDPYKAVAEFKYIESQSHNPAKFSKVTMREQSPVEEKLSKIVASEVSDVSTPLVKVSKSTMSNKKKMSPEITDLLEEAEAGPRDILSMKTFAGKKTDEIVKMISGNNEVAIANRLLLVDARNMTPEMEMAFNKYKSTLPSARAATQAEITLAKKAAIDAEIAERKAQALAEKEDLEETLSILTGRPRTVTDAPLDKLATSFPGKETVIERAPVIDSVYARWKLKQAAKGKIQVARPVEESAENVSDMEKAARLSLDRASGRRELGYKETYNMEDEFSGDAGAKWLELNDPEKKSKVKYLSILGAVTGGALGTLGSFKFSPDAPISNLEVDAPLPPTSFSNIVSNVLSRPFIALGDLFSPSEAAAAGLGDLGKRIVHATVIKTLGRAGMKPADLIKEVAEKWSINPIREGQRVLDDNQFVRTPSIVPNLNDVVKTKMKETLGFLQHASPFGQSRVLYKDDILGNPMVDLGLKEVAATQNANMQGQVVLNIMTEHGIKSESAAIAKMFAPLFDKKYLLSQGIDTDYATAQLLAGGHATKIDMLENLIETTTKKLGRKIDPAERSGLEELLEKSMYQLELNKAGFEKYSTALNDLNKLREPILMEVAAKYPSARVALALDNEELPWLLPLLKDNEKLAVADFRQLLDRIGMEAKASGESIFERDAYIHHAVHPKANYKEAEEILDRLDASGVSVTPLAHLRSRSLGSRQMMPDIGYIMDRYLPDVNKRIQYADFWKHGQKGGWHEHRIQIEKMGWRGGQQFWDGIADSLKPVSPTPINKAMRVAYAFEVAMRLVASPSVAFKHLMKLEAVYSNFGVGEGIKAIPQTATMFLDDVASDVMKSAGVKYTRNAQTEVMRAFTHQNRMGAMIADIGMYEPPTHKYERWLQTFNEKGAMLVNMTERFDRAHAFVAAMDMAAKKGMTADQAAYGVMDTILKNNFLTGNFNPAWLRDPKVRMLMMFQGTPFKILEQRLLLLARGGKAIGRTGEETLKALGLIRSDIKEAEKTLKMDLIKNAWNSEKDIYGNPFASQLMRKMMVLGTLIVGGKQLFDADLMEHTLHVPGVKVEGGSVNLSLNPMINAAVEAKPNEDEFWLSSFFQKWLPSGPVPAIANKAMRISNNDIPEQYRDSTLRYLFRVPFASKE